MGEWGSGGVGSGGVEGWRSGGVVSGGGVRRKTVGVFLDDIDRIIGGGGIADDDFHLIRHTLGDDRLNRLLEEATVVVVGNDDGKKRFHRILFSRVEQVDSGEVEEWRSLLAV